MAYRHTQFGTVMVASFGLGAAVFVGLLLGVGWRPVWAVALVVLALCMGLFYSLTVEVADGVLSWRFGLGVLGKRIPLAEVREAAAVRNRWYYGWGIHWTPVGWVHNVSGLDAVAITLASGKRYRIGTDEPGKLLEAIEQSMPDRATS